MCNKAVCSFHCNQGKPTFSGSAAALRLKARLRPHPRRKTTAYRAKPTEIHVALLRSTFPTHLCCCLAAHPLDSGRSRRHFNTAVDRNGRTHGRTGYSTVDCGLYTASSLLCGDHVTTISDYCSRRAFHAKRFDTPSRHGIGRAIQTSTADCTPHNLNSAFLLPKVNKSLDPDHFFFFFSGCAAIMQRGAASCSSFHQGLTQPVSSSAHPLDTFYLVITRTWTDQVRTVILPAQPPQSTL